MLLAVFLPMLVLSSFHVHSVAHHESGFCKECVNHLPHAGHIGSQTVCSFDCVLCQFFTLPFLAAAAVILVVNIVLRSAPLFADDQRVVSRERGFVSLRAPPVLAVHQ